MKHLLSCSLPVLAAALAISAAVAFGDAAPPLAPEVGHNAATGARTALSAAGEDPSQMQPAALGAREFHQRWVVLHSIGGKWGRGPTSNGEACTDCHAGHGRGQVPESANEALVSMVVKLSIPGHDEHGGPRPHPVYGEQLQNQGELGRVPMEGDAVIVWGEREEQLADGSRVTLRTPQLDFINLSFGPLGTDTLQSLRIAPALFGTGLFEAIAEDTVHDIARRQRELGFNGRPNYVWDVEKQITALGRFGWKSSQPSLRQQIASAYLNDMGITTSVFQQENCTPIQTACRKRVAGRMPEQSDRAFDELVAYIRTLDAPAQRHDADRVVLRGEHLFAKAQCAVCHVPDIRIGGDQVIHPYTDLLLHDMGDGLADGRPDFLAGPRDWRTPALWGTGSGTRGIGRAALLHDGRARSVTEAVLWHGGEAEISRETFRALSAADRAALLAFVDTL
ncbi:MAG: di-heme oxidoredictase family protein [Betaproteobacteria bacterium]